MVDVCWACDKVLGPATPAHANSNDPQAYQIFILICSGCRQTWDINKNNKVVGKVSVELNKNAKI